MAWLMSMTMSKTYSELIKLDTFEERFDYLKLSGKVGVETFGSDRYLNQKLYASDEWKAARRDVIIRDNGCDLGVNDRMLNKYILVHHINPITKEDILNKDPKLFDPENLICVSKLTHDAIHYGSKDILITAPVERSKNDTCPWRRD